MSLEDIVRVFVAAGGDNWQQDAITGGIVVFGVMALLCIFVAVAMGRG